SSRHIGRALGPGPWSAEPEPAAAGLRDDELQLCRQLPELLALLSRQRLVLLPERAVLHQRVDRRADVDLFAVHGTRQKPLRPLPEILRVLGELLNDRRRPDRI